MYAQDENKQAAEQIAGRVISSERDVERLIFVVDVAHRIVVQLFRKWPVNS